MGLLKRIKLLGKNYVGMAQRARATEEQKISSILEEISNQVGIVDDNLLAKIQTVKDEIDTLRANNTNLDDAQEAKLKELEDWIGAYDLKFNSGSTITQDIEDLNNDLDNILDAITTNGSDIDSINSSLQSTNSLSNSNSKLYKVVRNHDTNIEKLRSLQRYPFTIRVFDKTEDLTEGISFVGHLPTACYPIRLFVSLDSASSGSNVEFKVKVDSVDLVNRINSTSDFIIPDSTRFLTADNSGTPDNGNGVGAPLTAQFSNNERGSKIQVDITDNGDNNGAGTAAKGMTITLLLQTNTNMVDKINF